MQRRWITAVFIAALAVGCGGHRELVGEWMVVNSKNAPAGLTRMTFSDEKHLTLSTGEICQYRTRSDHTVEITFPNGKTFDYGFTRSGEDLTLVDNGRKIPYTLNQG